jgi:hypothetical protein
MLLYVWSCMDCAAEPMELTGEMSARFMRPVVPPPVCAAAVCAAVCVAVCVAVCALVRE